MVQLSIDAFSVFLVATDRPITYHPDLSVTANYQIELPGGVLENGESAEVGALREALEEGGITSRERVLATAPLWPLVAFDAGTNVELYAGQVCIISGKASPPNGVEGIIAEHCSHKTLGDAEDFLLQQQQKGVLVEGYTLFALRTLAVALVAAQI